MVNRWASPQPPLPTDPVGDLPERTAETLRFGLLGTLLVTGQYGPISINGVRRRTVLIRLLVERSRPVPLGKLAEDIWAGAPPPGAPSTLRSHLSLLRNALGADRLFTRNGAAVLKLYDGEYDVAIFEEETKQAHRALADGQQQKAEALFDHALNMWRGPALADAEEFAWALPEIVRLEEQRLGALEGLLSARLWLGDRQRVVAEAEVAVLEHPLREQLWAILMSALYQSGRQADSLRTYQRLRTHLAEELGIEPSPSLRDLEQSILNQELSSVPIDLRQYSSQVETSLPEGLQAQPRGSTANDETETGSAASDLTWVPSSDSTTFVGRDREIDKAKRARARVGPSRHVLLMITGEPGIGKTRLAAEVAAWCADGGDLVLYGRCDEDPLSSFQGFRQALSRIIRYPIGRSALTGVGSLIGQLCQIVPEASGASELAAGQMSVTAEAERFQSFEAVVSLIGGLARQHPLVLVLEDLQWADAPAISLLEYFLRSKIAASVFIIATYRDTEIGGKSWLSEGLVGLQRVTDVVRLDLVGLTPSKSFALFQSAIGPISLDEGANSSLLRKYTGGNPFFLQEVAKDIVASGETLDQLLATSSSSGSSVPERLKQVVHWRLMNLSEPCKSILSVAALMGLQFQVDALLAAADWDEEVLLSALDEAQIAGIIAEVNDEADSYRFVHDLVRHALDAELGTGRRVRTHLRIAQVLEERFGTVPSRASEIAFHFGQGLTAASADRAMFYFSLAGKSALSHVAYESAAAHFEQALEIRSRFTPGDDGDRCDLLLLLADSMVKSGQLVQADERYVQAFETGKALGRIDIVASAALGYGGVLPAGAEPNETGRRLLRSALDGLGPGDHPQRALAMGRLAHWEHFSEPREERRRIGDEAVAVAHRSGDAATLAAAIEYRYWALCGPDEVGHQVTAARNIRGIGEDLGDPELILRGMKCELHAEFEGGDFSVADQLAHQMRELAERVKQPEYLRLGFMWDSLVAGIQGKFAEAEQSAALASDIFRQSGHSQTNAIAVGLSLTWLWLQGRMAEMEPILQAGSTGRASLGEQALSAWIAVEAGRQDVARDILDAITPAMVAAEDRNFHWWFTMAGLSHAACNLNDVQWASSLYELVAPFSSHNCRVGQATFLGSASFYLGSLAKAAGRPNVAVPHLQDALVRHRAMAAAPFIDLTERALADAMSEDGRTGDQDGSQSMLR